MKINQSSTNWGYIAIALCCVTNAIAFVFVSQLTKNHNVMLSLAMLSVYTILLFHVINFRKLGDLYTKIVQNYRLIFSMNLLTGLNWIAGFLSLSYLDPATAVCVELAVAAVTMFFIAVPFKRFGKNKHLIFCLIFVLFSMSLIIMQYIKTTENIDFYLMKLGFCWSVLAGFSAAFIGTHSVRMDVAGFSLTQILATRFYLLAIVGFVMVFFTTSSHEVIVIDWKYYVFASLIVVIFPLVMYQASVKMIGPLLVSLLEPFTPVITYFLQVAIVGSYSFNTLTFCLLTISCMAVIWLVRMEQNMPKSGSKNNV